MDRKFKTVTLSGKRARQRDRQTVHHLDCLELDLASATVVSNVQNWRSNLCTDSTISEEPLAISKAAGSCCLFRCCRFPADFVGFASVPGGYRGVRRTEKWLGVGI